MERYNLPSAGIEVIITQDHKITTRIPYSSVAPSDKTPATNQVTQFLSASPAA